MLYQAYYEHFLRTPCCCDFGAPELHCFGIRAEVSPVANRKAPVVPLYLRLARHLQLNACEQAQKTRLLLNEEESDYSVHMRQQLSNPIALGCASENGARLQCYLCS